VLCGLQESLKIFSWEPIRCHDGVDVGWSNLSDMNVHEGKLLGCSYNQNCVGVWVVDLSVYLSLSPPTCFVIVWPVPYLLSLSSPFNFLMTLSAH
jgi:hypothetical protein